MNIIKKKKVLDALTSGTAYISCMTIESADNTETPLSPDMREWVTALRFSEVPYVFYEDDFPEKPKGTQPAKYMMIFAPENSDRHADKLIVEFDEDGCWSHTWLDSSEATLWMPLKESGFTIEETAFIITLQLEESNRSRSWPYHRAQRNSWSFPQSTEDMRKRMKKIQRAKIMRQIEMSAYTMLAAEHEEKYNELVEAASVEKALTSDWFKE